MNAVANPITILIADDDHEDQMLIRDAWAASRLVNDLRFVDDGEQLMDYLQRCGLYADPADSPRPGLVLLDLNMPKKNGLEALKEIKSDPQLQAIPIVVLTSSKEEEDVLSSYALGVSGFITKPVSFQSLVDVIKGVGKYWIEIVELPVHRSDE